ncbi:MAG TPA: hypothetical protein V6D30_04920 [Leptolyngbyaceae cyanobacterium]
MVQVIQAHDITLEQLIELFGLTITYEEQFFTEWLDNLPEVTDSEKQQLVSLWRRENELYKVLSILKKLGQLISQ